MILDVETDEFLVQEAVDADRTRIDFELTEERSIAVVVRQGPDDAPVNATYGEGRLDARWPQRRARQLPANQVGANRQSEADPRPDPPARASVRRAPSSRVGSTAPWCTRP